MILPAKSYFARSSVVTTKHQVDDPPRGDPLPPSSSTSRKFCHIVSRASVSGRCQIDMGSASRRVESISYCVPASNLETTMTPSRDAGNVGPWYERDPSPGVDTSPVRPSPRSLGTARFCGLTAKDLNCPTWICRRLPVLTCCLTSC